MTGAPSSRRIRDRSVATRWLAASLCCARVLPVDEELVRRAGPWIAAALDERPDLPPVGAACDLAALLDGDDLSATRARRAAIGDARLDRALRRWEDVVLARLGAERGLRAGGDAIAKLPAALRARGAGVFVARVLSNLGFERGVALLPGMARAAAKGSARALVEHGFAALREEITTRERIAEAYEALARGAEGARCLVTDADVFVLENLAALESLTQRLAFAQVASARDALWDALPRRIRATRRRAGAAVTPLEDESEYPMGGFSAIANAGSLENIVTSELVYMEPPSHRARGDYDLFDVRYAEGELLYYTRDEAQITRQRRVIDLVLMDDLARARVKDPALPWRRSVLLLGMVKATLEKVLAELGAEELRFRVVFARAPERAPGGAPSPLGAERELLSLVLREWREKGVVSIVESTLEDEAEALAREARRALVEVVLFTADARAATRRWARAAEGGRLDVACVAHEIAARPDLASWGSAAQELVAALL